ncbi:MAG: hypothetical protein AB7P09_03345 [Pyrinomonadaceae bacterium]
MFQIAAVVLAAGAGYFLWVRNSTGAFLCAVLGCVAFFLSIRAQVKTRNQLREASSRSNLERGDE